MYYQTYLQPSVNTSSVPHYMGTIHYWHNYSKLIISYMNDVNKINHSHETITV